MTDITDLIGVDATTFQWPQISSFAPFRPIQVVIEDDPKPLDPDVKLQIEQAWDQWTSTCTSEVDETDPLEDMKRIIEKARNVKLESMRHKYELTLWYQMMRQLEREAVVEDILINGIQPCKEPESTADARPKPTTPRDRLRALKAHPRSARGRR